MGLLNGLFGKTPPSTSEVAPDQVWMTENAKFTGIAQDLVDRHQTETNVILLVAHFPDVLKRLEEISAIHNGSIPVRAVLASNLTSDMASGLGDLGMIDLIIGERHPLRSVDDHLDQFVRELPCRSRVSHHLSIDDPVIKAFTGSTFKELLRTMGMKEDESIQNPMVTRQIQKSQRRLDRKTTSDNEAGSALEWLHKNCPELVSGKT